MTSIVRAILKAFEHFVGASAPTEVLVPVRIDHTPRRS
jgi:hypothetical protein